jgi:hypothetical protein
LDSTKEQRGNRRHLWSGCTGLSGVHRTVSGAPPDTVRCTRGFQHKLTTFRNFQRHSAIIHRTVRCTPDMSGAPRKGGLRNSPASGFHFSCSAKIHRTVRCNLGATATSRQRSPAGAFNARQKLAVVRHAGAGAPDTLQCMSGAPPDIKAGPEVRSSNGRNPTELVTWLGHRTVRCAPDCPVRHRTDSLHQRSCLVVGAINTPTTPPFIASKSSNFQPLYKS